MSPPPDSASQAPSSIAGIGSAGWVRGARFDAFFIAGTAALALAVGFAAALEPDWLIPLLVANLWTLGYQHVIATFTRLSFDTESLRQHRFLVFGLPVLVLAGVVTVLAQLGMWAIATAYLYWQWFHYTRQSYGIERIYWRKTEGTDSPQDWASSAVIYAVPLWGILHRSFQSPPTFLGMEVLTLPVPAWIDTAAGVVAVTACVYWACMRGLEAVRGELRVAHTLYVLSHIAVFTSGYILIEDINPGWLLLNVWHNTQYLLVVWMFNTNRFKSGVDREHRFLSTLSQPGNAVLYVLACVAISVGVYAAAFEIADRFVVAAVAGGFIVGQTANFHHYIVDSVIWKRPKPAVRATVGFAA